jgi:hypothetical protein
LVSSLKIWNGDTFISDTLVDQSDNGLTNGTADLVLINKTPSRAGSTAQVSNIQYYEYTGGLTLDIPNNQLVLDTIPATGLQWVSPGLTTIVCDCYDQDDVSGVSNPRQSIPHFWVGADVTDITTYEFMPVLGATSIPITVTDLLTGIGPDATWFQVAACNASGVPGTYSATGVSLNMLEISASALVAVTQTAGNWTLSITGTGSGTSIFQPADYIVINPGNVTSEIARIATISGSNISLTSGLNYNHFAGQNEGVYVLVREYALMETVPLNATGGLPQTFINMSVNVTSDVVQRI